MFKSTRSPLPVVERSQPLTAIDFARYIENLSFKESLELGAIFTSVAREANVAFTSHSLEPQDWAMMLHKVSGRWRESLETVDEKIAAPALLNEHEKSV